MAEVPKKKIVVFVFKDDLPVMEKGIPIEGWKITHKEKIGKVFSPKELDFNEVKFGCLEKGKLSPVSFSDINHLLGIKYSPYYIEVERVEGRNG